MQCVSSLNSKLAFVFPNKGDRNRKKERVRNSIVRYIKLIRGIGYMIRYYYIDLNTESHKNIMSEFVRVFRNSVINSSSYSTCSLLIIIRP